MGHWNQPLDSATADQIAALYAKERISREEVARRCGVHPNTVTKVAKKRGLQRGKGGRGRPDNLLSHAELERTARAYQLGMSLSQVSRLVGRSQVTVRQRLLTAGVPLRDRFEGQRLRRRTEPFGLQLEAQRQSEV